jgi:DNA-binding MarR family transcriptional regulator
MQQLLPATKSTPRRREHDCAGALLDVLPGLMRFVRRHMRSRRAKGLSVPQFRTLVHLRRCRSVSLSHVSESLGSSPPTASRIVSGLVSRGLVVRETCRHDRRQVTLQLTPRGQAVTDAAWLGTQGIVAQRLAGLSESQLATLAKGLALLSDVFPHTGHGEEAPSRNS